MVIVVTMVLFKDYLETYYLIGNDCHKNLKTFVEKMQENHDI